MSSAPASHGARWCRPYIAAATCTPLLPCAHPASPTPQVWDHGGSGFIRWHAADSGLSRMGVVVENTVLQAALLRAALGSSSGEHTAQAQGVAGVWPAAIRSLDLPPYAPTSSSGQAGGLGERAASGGGASSSSSSSCELVGVHLQDGRHLRCRLLVGADGGRSLVRQMAGLRTLGWQYGQRGVVASVSTAAPSHTAWQRFLPTGPLALLPVRDGYSNIVWSTTPEAAAALEALDSAGFAGDARSAGKGGKGADAGCKLASVAVCCVTMCCSAYSVLHILFPPANSLHPSCCTGCSLATLPATTAAVNQALQEGAPSPGSPGPFSALLPPAPPSSRERFQLPPLVEGWVGSSPKSFPLQMQHSGRWVSQLSGAPHMHGLCRTALAACHEYRQLAVNLVGLPWAMRLPCCPAWLVCGRDGGVHAHSALHCPPSPPATQVCAPALRADRRCSAHCAPLCWPGSEPGSG